MHYYQFNIADYRKDTIHLTPIEHYIYRTLIDWYYLDEQPIPKITQSVMRRLGLVIENEQSVKNVLQDFFYECDEGWRHRRIDQEITEYHAKCGINKTNGKLGGRPKKTQSVISCNPNESETKANETLTNNHKPINTIKEKNTKKEKIAVAFVLPDWINPDDWNLWIKTRKKKMQPEQMQAQVRKLERWKDDGLDYASALHESAVNGWQGLFDPSRNSKPNMQQSKGKPYHQKITDTLSQVFGKVENGNTRKTIDITPEETDRSCTENLPEVRSGFR